ncbi:MAG: helix-turn-helix domain-containing protein [Ruminococcus sp.]|nr:helix-turn-helix domain-containing protein [Ruminococcus sp.]
MTITERIFSEIQQKHINQKEFARQIGVNEKTFSSWKVKNTLPAADKISIISDLLGVSTDYLLTGKEKSPSAEQTAKEQLTPDEQELLENYRRLSEHDKGKVIGKAEALAELTSEQQEKKTELIPLYYVDNKVSAGLGASLSDYEQGDTVYVPETPESRRADFVLKISGDSMEPRFYDGEYVLVRSQPVVEVGQIGIFGNNGDGLIKKLGNGQLISINKKYKPLIVTENTICFGLVLGTTEILEK